MRIYACHAGDATHPVGPRVAGMRDREVAAGLTTLPRYLAFAEQVWRTKRDLLRFLSAAKEAGKTVAGYGALGKGNTLLNFCGVRTDFSTTRSTSARTSRAASCPAPASRSSRRRSCSRPAPTTC